MPITETALILAGVVEVIKLGSTILERYYAGDLNEEELKEAFQSMRSRKIAVEAAWDEENPKDDTRRNS